LTARIPASLAEGVALSPDGTTLAWSAGISGRTTAPKVTLVRLADGETLGELRTTGPVAVVRVAFTPDGKFVLGQTGYCPLDAVYSSFGRSEGLAPVYEEHTDRVCIWDAADGKLLAWLRGRAFADGFGPHGELAVARARRSGNDAEVEIDLWRPTELVGTLEHEGLDRWVHFLDREVPGTSEWGFGLGVLQGLYILVPLSWWAATIGRIEQKRVTARTAYTGIASTLLSIGGGVSFFMAAVAQLRGHGDNLAWLAAAAGYPAMGLLYFCLAYVTGALALKCYTYVVHGEAVAFFEALQAVSEAERKQREEGSRQFVKSYRRWLLGWIIGFVVTAYLDGCFLLNVSWDSGWLRGINSLYNLLLITMVSFTPNLFVLPVLYVIVALVEARWGPAKRPWFVPPPADVQTRWARFIVRVFNLFPLSRAASIAYWLLVLLGGLGLAGFELHTRLAGGDWPRPSNAFLVSPNSTGLLALAVFDVLFSALRLVRLTRGV
jgi:hypothetical protein